MYSRDEIGDTVRLYLSYHLISSNILSSISNSKYFNLGFHGKSCSEGDIIDKIGDFEVVSYLLLDKL